MKELILDLRGVDTQGGETWADCPERAKIEGALLDHAGQVVRVRITQIKRYGGQQSWWHTKERSEGER